MSNKTVYIIEDEPTLQKRLIPIYPFLKWSGISGLALSFIIVIVRLILN